MAKQNSLEDKKSIAAGIIQELGSTTKAVNTAAKKFKAQMEQVNSALSTSVQEYREQNQELSRLKRSLGDAAKSYSGISAITAQEIKIAEQKVVVGKAAVDQAQQAAAANQQYIDSQIKEADATFGKLEAVTAEQSAIQESIQARKDTIPYIQSQIQAAQDEQLAIDERKSAIRDANAALQAEADASRDLERYMQSQIAAAQEDVAASNDRIASLRQNEETQKSQIDAVNEEIRRLQGRGEFKGRGKQKEITAEEEKLIAALQAKKESILAAFNETKEMRKAEIAYRDSIATSIPGMEADMQAAADAAGEYESAINQNNETLAREGMKRLALSEAIGRMESEVSSINDGLPELEAYNEEYQRQIEGLSGDLESYAGRILEAQEEQKKLNKAVEDRMKEEQTLRDELRNAKIKAFTQKVGKISEILGKVSEEIGKVVGPIRKMQQEFGLSAGSAAKLKLTNMAAAAKSLVTPGAPVTGEEIEGAQSAFQSEFGGVLTSQAGADIARQAKEMGVGAGELAKARRVFMTQTMGDTGAAKAAQDKFVSEFTKKGLTSKDAMAAIGANSELLARNGTRFATSFARAAADAKKIGVDLGKIDQVGDNIIGDFEGFLEKQAELGAMGFGFDSSRLAEVAESGDTGALMEELRSQLAAQGKDLTKLRRSEQLALSQAFGISMEELQRLSAPKGKEGSGEATLSPEELQQDSNKSLTRLVNFAESAAIVSGVMSGLLGIIARNTGGFLNALSLLPGALKTVFGGARSVVSSVGGGIKRIFTRGGTPPAPGGEGGGGFFRRMFGRGGAPTPGGAPGTPPIPGAGGPGAGGSLAGAPSAVPSAGPGGAPGAGGGGEKLSFMEKMDAKKMLAGAAALLIVSAALYVTAKAVQEFMKVEWSAMGKAGVALLGLVAAVAAIGAIMMSGVGAVAILAGAGALLAIGGALMMVGKAIQIASPGFTALGTLVTSVFNGMATIVTAVGAALTSMLTQLKGMSAGQIIALAAALPAFAGGLTVLAGALAIFPTMELGRVAGKFAKFSTANAAATGIRGVATALKELGTVVNGIDANKLTQVISATRPSLSQTVLSAGAAVAGGVRNVAGRVANFFGIGGGTQPATQTATTTNAPVAASTAGTVTAVTRTTTTNQRTQQTTTPAGPSLDFTRLEAKLDQVVNAIGRMNVEMDGQKVGRILVGRTDSATTVGVMRRG